MEINLRNSSSSVKFAKRLQENTKSWKSHVSTSLPKYKFIIQSQMQLSLVVKFGKESMCFTRCHQGGAQAGQAGKENIL